MTTHTLQPDASTLHGYFSKELTPALRIQPGDTVEASTLDAGWGLEAPHLDGTPREKHPAHASHPENDHSLIGPIWIDGAQPGMTLVVHIEQVIPGAYGLTYAGGFPHRVHEALGFVEDGGELLLWTLDADMMTGTNQHGHTIRLNPFLGVMGMPPPDDGTHPTAPPRTWGGNIDCKDMVAGTRLYLPVPVEGGLFSFGDGHAAQGHGEVSVQAIECPMEHVRLRFELEDAPLVQTPYAWTPDGWLTFGFHEDMEQATFAALDAMLSLMVAHYRLSSRKQALGLATAVVDLHITQIANPVFGVHAFLPNDALDV
jgi:acetamidase/formamidase